MSFFVCDVLVVPATLTTKMKIDWDATWQEVLQQIQPTEDDFDKCSAAISSLQNVLRQDWELSDVVEDITTNGSYAKGTMLKGRLEVDIVVFVSGSSTLEDCRQSFRSCICKMWTLGDEARVNRHSVQFRHPRTGVDVDLLFTYELDARSGLEVFLKRREFQPQWSGKRERRRNLTDFDMLRDSSSSVAEHQVQLIKHAGRQAISLIQLAKALKARFMDATHTYLPSYVVEVLALKYMQEMRVFDFDEGLQYIFSQLRDLESDFVFHLCPDAALAGITSPDVESYWRGHKQWSAGAGLKHHQEVLRTPMLTFVGSTLVGQLPSNDCVLSATNGRTYYPPNQSRSKSSGHPYHASPDIPGLFQVPPCKVPWFQIL